jgi:hypothetical protein
MDKKSRWIMTSPYQAKRWNDEWNAGWQNVVSIVIGMGKEHDNTRNNEKNISFWSADFIVLFNALLLNAYNRIIDQK